jgi:seryl-tRNA synthetase
VIDLRLLRDNPDLVRASQRARGQDEGAVDVLLAAAERRRSAVGAFEGLRAEQKSLSKGIASAQGEEKADLLARTKNLARAVKDADSEVSAAETALREAHLAVPNVADPRTPPGGEDDYVVLREVGSKPVAGASGPPADHLALGEALGAIDTQRGAKVSGARFYFLTGVGAMLELALTQLAMSNAVSWGFTPVVAPAMVKPSAMEGTGFLGAHTAEVYRLEADEMFLVGTSEVPLAAMHAEEILDLSAGPRRYAGYSSCFRREAGSYGKDTRGIIRVHQFEKVEMFSYCPLADAGAEHERLLAWEEEFLGLLEVPYRVIDVAAGDLGTSATRKFDCEAWLPSQGRYLELTSTSNCTDFQARRLGVRERDPEGRPRPVATLNGTLCAMTRAIVVLLENHQQPDGSVRVPLALRPFLAPFLGSDVEVLEPVGRPAGGPVRR